MELHIQHVILWEFKNIKNTSVVFMAKVSLLTTESETGIQSMIPEIHH